MPESRIAATWFIVLSFVGTFGVPIVPAVRELLQLGKPGGDGQHPPFDGLPKPLPDCLLPRTVVNPRVATELAGAALIARHVDVRTIWLPQVHDTTRAGLITPLVAEARRAGAVAYLSKGQTRWAAAHVSDVAKLYVLAL